MMSTATFENNLAPRSAHLFYKNLGKSDLFNTHSNYTSIQFENASVCMSRSLELVETGAFSRLYLTCCGGGATTETIPKEYHLILRNRSINNLWEY